MAGPQELGQLTDDEYADLNDRVDRFHTAWKIAGSASIAAFLPPSRSRHRRHVLIEMIKTEMELRAKVGLPIQIERYLDQFAAELPPDEIPTTLIMEEYLLRHRYGDRPNIEAYRARFPEQYPEFCRLIASNPPTRVPNRNAPGGSVGINGSGVQATPTPDLVEQTRVAPVEPRRGPNTPLSTGDFLPAGLQYKLIRQIGRGAFGEVFEAEAPGGFRVAVKRILRDVDHPASQGEIASLEVLKAMAHPFLLQTQAYWVFQDRLVIVMELAEGSLADRIEHHKQRGLMGVPPEELIPYFEQAAQALDYLHSHNVTHRDIKPQNLLHLKGYAKVADFGLTRQQQHDETQVGMEVGTAMFMAPEVWDHKVNLHSDQYSLAASYVQARLGRPVFPSKLIGELCRNHILDTPVLDPLPAAEQTVVLKALAKKPADRYPNCLSFVQALDNAVLRQPTPSRRWLFVTVGGLMIGAVGLAIATLMPPPPTPPPPSVPPSPPPLPPPLLQPWCPAGWQPENSDEIATLPNGKRLHPRLVRDVGAEQLIAVLIQPENASDPPAYYLAMNKITNRVFAAIWEQSRANPRSTLHRLLDAPPLGSERYFPGMWRKGALNIEDEPLGITGEQAGVPVVGVTAPEAMVVAEELGGFLPTYRQWVRATRVPGHGPAGPIESIGEDLTQRPLALGLKSGPWPVDRSTVDRGVGNVHQLTSNGYEWTRTRIDDENAMLSLTPVPAIPYELKLAGQPWDLAEVLTNQRIDEKNRTDSWLETMNQIGFRIVIEPE